VKNWKKWIVRLTLLGLFAGIGTTLFAFYTYRKIEQQAASYCFDELSALPAVNVALVLGTSDSLRSGRPNMYFQHRINCAAKLYHSRKVKHFILSGDNHIKSYDEPEAMRQALIALGIPDSCLTLDYAGFRTFDSVIRCREVFGQDSVIIISQAFHNLRAVYIARENEITAYGMNAQDAYGIHSPKREYLARANAWLDIHLFNTRPKFLGKKIKLPI